MPVRATKNAAAFDLCAAEPAVITRGMVTIVGTGIGWEPDDTGLLGLILPRSGLAATHGIMVVNSPGLIDADYRGEIKVILTCVKFSPFAINPGDRIAQLLIMRAVDVSLVLRAKEFVSNTERAVGGLGSTGR